MAVTVGGAMAKQAASQAKDDIQNDYNANTAQQQDVHSAPETPSFIGKCFLWLPIRYVAWIGGISLLISPILDIILFKISFVYVVILFYLLFFGVLATFVESPVFKLTRTVKIKENELVLCCIACIVFFVC